MKDLNTLHTRVLLRLLNHARRHGVVDPDKVFPDGGYYDHTEGYTFDQVKAVLNTREHIPNKKEARKKRKENLKKKRSKGNTKFVNRCPSR